MVPKVTAHDNYARHLDRLQFGYPLWNPESINGTEVEIGAVGYMLDGGFHTLFNATTAVESGSKTEDFPKGHKPLPPPPKKSFLSYSHTTQSLIIAGATQETDVSGKAGGQE